MKLGKQVGLVPGHIELYEDLAPSPKGAQPPPNFRLMSFVAKRLDGLRCHMEVGLGPGDSVLVGTHLPSPKGTEPSNFRPMSIVAKRLNASRCYLVWR